MTSLLGESCSLCRIRSDIGVLAKSRLPPSDTQLNAAGKHVYDLEHLATFSAIDNGSSQLLSPHSGVSRIREMALTGAIWPLKVKIVITGWDLAVFDYRTGEEMENFPLALISDPTSVTATHRRSSGNQTLDNIVLFTVLEDPVTKSSPPEMHVFQCISQSVSKYF